MFETVLLGTLGPEDYNKVWSGELAFDDPKVKKALETFKRMLRYTNSDHAARNWQDAAQMVAKGEAAMNEMGVLGEGLLHHRSEIETEQGFRLGSDSGDRGHLHGDHGHLRSAQGGQKSRSRRRLSSRCWAPSRGRTCSIR